MKFTHRLTLQMAGLATLSLLASCGGINFNGASFTLPTYNISVSPQPASIPVGTTVTFTATTDAPTTSLSWVLNSYAYANLGSPNTASNTTTFVYTAPATPPIYSNNILTAGHVTVDANAGATQLATSFVITAPSVTTGITAVNTSVALGATQIVYAYAVGSINNALTLQVNGVTGGSTTTGTITAVGGIYGQYLYTAPTSLPVAGNPVTLTVISQADPTKTSTLAITLH
jgi:hypothetical protein